MNNKLEKFRMISRLADSLAISYDPVKEEQLKDLVSTLEGEGIDFREVVENLVDGVYVTDSKGITRYVNPAYCRHVGIAPENVVGRSVQDIAQEGVYFKHAVSTDVIKWRRNVNGAGVFRRVDGHNVTGYVTGVPLFDERGRVKNVVVSVFDAEKLKRRWSEYRQSLSDPIRILENFEKDSLDSSIIGSDAAISNVRRTIIHAAPTDAPVLITGESGVGKESIADRVYALSDRTGGPYVKVNCNAIPHATLEAELFGCERGVMTGVNAEGKVGLLELANNGTILLDEIGDLPMELQTKLLRVLQNKELTRVGGVKTIPLDVRIIASTNTDLKRKIQEGSFREDLYYRLSVIPIHIPSLRERRGDIASLARYYFNEYTLKHGRDLTLTAEDMLLLETYDWPGNVRELQNVLEYMVIISDDGQLDHQRMLEILGLEKADEVPQPGLAEATALFEKGLIENALKEAGGVRKAAAVLKVDPSTVSRKAKKYGIALPEGE